MLEEQAMKNLSLIAGMHVIQFLPISEKLIFTK